MKAICVFCLLCFVLNFHLFAQDTCTDEGVKVSISEIVWDATAADLPSTEEVPFYGDVPTESFHIVYLEYEFSPDFVLDGYQFSFDLSVIRSNKPVVLLFQPEIPIGDLSETGLFIVNPILDADILITGFHIERLDVSTMGGVATSAGLMVRESVLGSFCVDISIENQLSASLDGTTCQLPDEIVRKCRTRTLNPINTISMQIGRREAQNPHHEVDIYPIPTQNNVFIDVNDSEIKNVQIIDIQGKTRQHQTSIRYSPDRIQVNTTQLESGMYWLQLETDKGVICRKIIIQK